MTPIQMAPDYEGQLTILKNRASCPLFCGNDRVEEVDNEVQHMDGRGGQGGMQHIFERGGGTMFFYEMFITDFAEFVQLP